MAKCSPHCKCADQPEPKSELEQATGQIQQLVIEGLKHGFFDMNIHVSTVQANRRQLVVEAGKSYQYVIRESDIL